MEEQYFEVTNFFNTIYPFKMKGGGVILDDACFTGNKFLSETKSMIRHAVDRIKRTGTAVASMNVYRQYKGKCRRSSAYLWRLNHIVIDIDYMGSTVFNIEYLENTLEQNIIWHIESYGIPAPNYIVFTGLGGCHLYYQFEDLPNANGKMEEAVQALKMKLVSAWVETEKNLDVFGAGYQVDVQAVDSSRVFRVPGSIHPDTGRICRMKDTGTPRYIYKNLCSLVDEKRWNGQYAVINAFRDIENTRAEGGRKNKIFKPFFGHGMTAHYLGVKRLNELMSLAEHDWGFSGCREKAGHLAWVWARDAGMDEMEIKEYLIKLNKLFYAPLTVRELFYTARGSGKSYKYTNERIRSVLGIDSSDGYFTGGRSRKFKDRAGKAKKHKKMIAALILAGKKIREIAGEIGLSISLIKRRRTEMKNAEGFTFWASCPA